MKFKMLNFPFIVTLILALSAVSCSDVWDEHYNSEPLNKSSLNLYQYISKDSTLTKFAQMLRVTGYDSILSRSQSYTVWAPTNESLSQVNVLDLRIDSLIVKNHITRFSYSTSILASAGKMLRMFDDKLLQFNKTATGFTFGGKPIIKSDLAVKNGIVHIIGEYVPYTPNFLEFIEQHPGLDSLRTYINSLYTKTYDPTASFQDKVFVDSVFKSTNYLLNNIAALNVEDSIYTAILPNNAAWIDASNRIKTFYKFLDADGGVTAQMAYTKQRLVRNLFFRGNVVQPITADTLASTYRYLYYYSSYIYPYKFANPSRLFNTTDTTRLSNGLAYVTSKLMHKATESWFDTIRVEAENANFKTGDKINYDATINSSAGTNFKTSGGRYMYLKDASTSGLSAPFATFEIPNTLSGKYNIYCVLPPGNIAKPGDLRSVKVRFYLSYIGATGKQVINQQLKLAGDPYISVPNVVNKIKVAENFVFPYCNLQYDATKTYVPTVKLKVVTAVTFSSVPETAAYIRDLLIDCIILEPVE